MRIAIIGAGNVGSALGRAWLGGAEDVVFGVPSPADPKGVVLVSIADCAADAHSVIHPAS